MILSFIVNIYITPKSLNIDRILLSIDDILLFIARLPASSAFCYPPRDSSAFIASSSDFSASATFSYSSPDCPDYCIPFTLVQSASIHRILARSLGIHSIRLSTARLPHPVILRAIPRHSQYPIIHRPIAASCNPPRDPPASTTSSRDPSLLSAFRHPSGDPRHRQDPASTAFCYPARSPSIHIILLFIDVLPTSTASCSSTYCRHPQHSVIIDVLSIFTAFYYHSCNFGIHSILLSFT